MREHAKMHVTDNESKRQRRKLQKNKDLVASSEFSQNSLVIGPSISNAESLLLPDDTKPEVSGSV